MVYLAEHLYSPGSPHGRLAVPYFCMDIHPMTSKENMNIYRSKNLGQNFDGYPSSLQGGIWGPSSHGHKTRKSSREFPLNIQRIFEESSWPARDYPFGLWSI